MPNELPQVVTAEGIPLPLTTGYAHVSIEVAAILGCAQNLVDILDSGDGYVAYSIFDYEGAANHSAMSALAAISAHSYDVEDDDQVLQGPVLLVTAS